MTSFLFSASFASLSYYHHLPRQWYCCYSAKRLASAAVSSRVSSKEKRDLPFPHLESLLLQQQRHHQTSFVPALALQLSAVAAVAQLCADTVDSPSSSASEAVPPLPCPIFQSSRNIFARASGFE